MKRNIIAVFLALVLMVGVAHAQPLIDVPTSHWAYEAITELVAKGIINAYPDGSFKGEKKVSRNEIAVMIQRALSASKTDKISQADLALLEKLSVEFSDELVALATKVNRLETKLERLEDDFETMAEEGISSDMGGGISGVNISGLMKFGFIDYVDGTSDGVAGDVSNGFQMKEFDFYVTTELSDKFSFYAEVPFSASTSATPSIGSAIGANWNPDSGGWEHDGMGETWVKYLCPNDWELKFGTVHPRFTWDYGAKEFWAEQYIGSKSSSNPTGGSFLGHDMGFEIYDSWDAGEWSVPTYVYLMSGGGEFGDNNRELFYLLRFEPEFGPWQVGLSYATGVTSDKGAATKNKETRTSLGLRWQEGDWQIRSEYVDYKLTDKFGAGVDSKAHSYYLKVFKQLSPSTKLMLAHDVAKPGQVFFNYADLPEEYITDTICYILNVTEETYMFFQYDMADWKRVDNSKAVEFDRFVVGMRCFF